MLFKAVRNYASSCVGGTCVETSDSAEQYGFPMNCWKVGAVTSLSFLFYKMQTFNEVISSWETGQVIPHCTCITSYIILFENLIISSVIRPTPWMGCSGVPRVTTSLFCRGILGR